MNEQSLALRLPGTVATLPQAKPDEALVKMLDEAERTIVARIQLNPIKLPAQRTDQAEQTQRVRYAYD
jgi:hypothetical protein